MGGRMHSNGKGISRSAIPYKRTAPAWLKSTSEDEVVELICRLAKKGMTPSQIGVVLRDSHGIPLVKNVTGNKILRILRGKGLAPEIPEDLYCMIKKAVSMRKHLEPTAATRTPSSASFWSSPASTAWPATTRRP